MTRFPGEWTFVGVDLGSGATTAIVTGEYDPATGGHRITNIQTFTPPRASDLQMQRGPDGVFRMTQERGRNG